MILTNRRHRILYLALAAMEMAWLAPFVVLTTHYWWRRLEVDVLRARGLEAQADALLRWQTMPPATLFLLLFATMVVYMLAADLLNRRPMESPARELVMAGLVLSTSLLSVRLFLYTDTPPYAFDWLRETADALFNFTAGRRPEILMLLLSGFIWWRVAANTDRDLAFFAVGVSFRLGLLLSVVGNAMLVTMGLTDAVDAFTYFALFMFAGLTAVSVARIDEKALLTEHSRGAILPWVQVAQVTAAALVTLVLGTMLALIYRPDTIVRVLGWFSPLWTLLAMVAGLLVYALAWLLAPLMNVAVRWLQWLLARIEPIEPPQQEQAFGEIVAVRPADITALLDRYDSVRYGLVVLMVFAALLVIWFFFLRTRRRPMEEEAEEWGQERLSFGGNLLARGFDRIRNLLELVRRYGVGTQLLAAISIQNIYANVMRMARTRGHARPAAQPPDLFLPVLQRAFPGCEAALDRITEAYMRVEYGDQALANIELDALRADYRQVRASPPPASSADVDDQSAVASS